MTIDPRSDRAVYQQIADLLRDRIRTGTYPAGTKLPSETQLIDELGATRQTIRHGLAVLRREGLTEAARGRGVFVRQAPPVIAVRNNRFSRAAQAAGRDPLAAEAEALGLDWRSEDLGPVETVTVPADIAAVLGEDQAVVTRRRTWVGGTLTQLADSYIPASIDAAVGYSGATAPGGIYGLLEQHGHQITRYREELAIRHATPEEAGALELPLAAPVVILTRCAIDQDGRVVEYVDSVAAGDKHRYIYETDADD